MNKAEEMYKNNNDFKEYVDRFANNREITVEEALKHRIVADEITKTYEKEC